MPGKITRRGEGWSFVVDMGRDPRTGKRRQVRHTVRGLKSEAQALQVRLLSERDGTDSSARKMTVSAWLERWLKVYGEPRLAPRTIAAYDNCIRLHLVPAIGMKKLTKLRPMDIEECYAQVIARGRSVRTALHVHRVLRQALQYAVRIQVLNRNPADSVEAPRPARYPAPTITVQMAMEILEAAEKTRYGAMVYLAIMTGLRLGELQGLRWQDLDLAAGTLQVRQIFQSYKGKSFRQPKTHRSTRGLTLTPATVDRLKRHRQAQLETRLLVGGSYTDRDLVFATDTGGPIDGHQIRDAWARILKLAGLTGIRFHDLRHAHASLMLAQGTHPKIVQERLGHSAIAITLDTYSHVVPNLQRQEADKLDRLLGL